MEKSMENIETIYELECGFQNYAWGQIGEQSTVYQIAKQNNDKLDAEKPFAELWMGSHKNMPSKIIYNNQKIDLGEAIQQNQKHFLGDYVSQQFSIIQGLPFLFKVLSVKQALSIQAHPDKLLAEKLFKNDPEHYKDDNHKPEMAIALTEYEALCKFCQKDDFLINVKQFQEFEELLDQQLLEKFTKEEGYENQKVIFKQIFNLFMHIKDDIIVSSLQKMIQRLSQQENKNQRELLVLKLYSQYPDDIGVFVSLFMNYITLKPGDCLVMEANEPHAYISGDCLECMANSDNVVRLGLTPKFRDNETLINMLTYELKYPQIQKGHSITSSNEIEIIQFDSGYKEFKCYSFNFKQQNCQIKKVCNEKSPMIMIVIQGEGQIISEQKQQISLKLGKVMYICPGARFQIQSGKNEKQLLFYLCGITDGDLHIE